MTTSPAQANDPVDVANEGLEDNDDEDNPFGVYPEADIAEYVAAEEADGRRKSKSPSNFIVSITELVAAETVVVLFVLCFPSFPIFSVFLLSPRSFSSRETNSFLEEARINTHSLLCFPAMTTSPAPAKDPVDVVNEGWEDNDDEDNPFGGIQRQISPNTLPPRRPTAEERVSRGGTSSSRLLTSLQRRLLLFCLSFASLVFLFSHLLPPPLLFVCLFFFLWGWGALLHYK